MYALYLRQFRNSPMLLFAFGELHTPHVLRHAPWYGRILHCHAGFIIFSQVSGYLSTQLMPNNIQELMYCQQYLIFNWNFRHNYKNRKNIFTADKHRQWVSRNLPKWISPAWSVGKSSTWNDLKYQHQYPFI